MPAATSASVRRCTFFFFCFFFAVLICNRFQMTPVIPGLSVLSSSTLCAGIHDAAALKSHGNKPVSECKSQFLSVLAPARGGVWSSPRCRHGEEEEAELPSLRLRSRQPLLGLYCFHKWSQTHYLRINIPASSAVALYKFSFAAFCH